MKLNPAPSSALRWRSCLATLGVQATVVNLSTSFEQPVATEGGGRTLLVEEITATWCPSCAEIDPELLQVADRHGSRIALVALHPSDGRMRSNQQRASIASTDSRKTQMWLESTPTFVVESGEPRRGYDAWTEVQRDILNAELAARPDISELDIEVVKTDNGYRASLTHTESGVHQRHATHHDGRRTRQNHA